MGLTNAAGYASGPQPVSPTDPKLIQAQSLLEDGTRALEEGDLPRAKAAYEESIKSMPTSGAWFNLGVVEYQLGEWEGMRGEGAVQLLAQLRNSPIFRGWD